MAYLCGAVGDGIQARDKQSLPRHTKVQVTQPAYLTGGHTLGQAASAVLPGGTIVQLRGVKGWIRTCLSRVRLPDEGGSKGVG